MSKVELTSDLFVTLKEVCSDCSAQNITVVGCLQDHHTTLLNFPRTLSLNKHPYKLNFQLPKDTIGAVLRDGSVIFHSKRGDIKIYTGCKTYEH